MIFPCANVIHTYVSVHTRAEIPKQALLEKISQLRRERKAAAAAAAAKTQTNGEFSCGSSPYFPR